LTFFVPAGTKADEVSGLWENAVDKCLFKFHEIDKSVCILQGDPSIASGGTTKRVYGKADFPLLWMGWKPWIRHENPRLFDMNALADKPRRIESTCLMGFGVADDEVREFLSDITTDLKCTKGLRGVQVNFQYQEFQAWHVKHCLTLLHGPTACPMSNYALLGGTLLSELEKKLVTIQPHIYPPSVHSGQFPKLECRLDWCRSGTFTKGVVGEDRSHRKIPIFTYEASDEDRIMAVVMECKRLEGEKKTFGQKAFWQQLPDKPDDQQKKTMDNYIFDQGALQKSCGNSCMYGLTNPDYPVTIEFEPGYDGVVPDSPGALSVRDILGKVWHLQERVFQSILLGWDGSYRAFFYNSGVCQEQGLEISSDAASWLKVYLLRRGVKLRCVRKLINRSFTQEAATCAGHADYDHDTGKVISGNEVRRQQHAQSFYSGSINREAAMTPSELEEARNAAHIRSELAKANAALPELGEGDFGAFAFGDDMSVRTLTKDSSKKKKVQPSGLSQASSYRPEANSTHSFAGATPGFENLDGSDDEELSDAEDNMEFDMEGMNSGKGEDDMEEDSNEGEEEGENRSMATNDVQDDGTENFEDANYSLGDDDGSTINPTNLDGAFAHQGEAAGDEMGRGGGEDISPDAFQQSFCNVGGTQAERRAVLARMLAELEVEETDPPQGAGGAEEMDSEAQSASPGAGGGEGEDAPASTAKSAHNDDDDAPGGTPPVVGANSTASNADEANTNNATDSAASTSHEPPECQVGQELPPPSGGEAQETGDRRDVPSDPG